jgi:hypothetical protein
MGGALLVAVATPAAAQGLVWPPPPFIEPPSDQLPRLELSPFVELSLWSDNGPPAWGARITRNYTPSLGIEVSLDHKPGDADRAPALVFIMNGRWTVKNPTRSVFVLLTAGLAAGDGTPNAASPMMAWVSKATGPAA